jgi:Fe2+ transport system protein FeoA
MTSDTLAVRTLDQLLPGQAATIRQVGGRGTFRRRMSDIGLNAGTTIQMMGANPWGDPIEYSINGCVLTLRRAEARVIVVEFE